MAQSCTTSAAELTLNPLISQEIYVFPVLYSWSDAVTALKSRNIR